eukprot:scaffold29973_cov61-Phaeocystis_antarctica.AAC.4
MTKPTWRASAARPERRYAHSQRITDERAGPEAPVCIRGRDYQKEEQDAAAPVVCARLRVVTIAACCREQPRR